MAAKLIIHPVVITLEHTAQICPRDWLACFPRPDPGLGFLTTDGFWEKRKRGDSPTNHTKSTKKQSDYVRVFSAFRLSAIGSATAGGL